MHHGICQTFGLMAKNYKTSVLTISVTQYLALTKVKFKHSKCFTENKK